LDLRVLKDRIFHLAYEVIKGTKVAKVTKGTKVIRGRLV
jgi:hypothetical protein